MAFPHWRLFMSGRASRLRTAYVIKGIAGPLRATSHEDAEHICAQTMEKIMPLRTNRDAKTVDHHLRCGARAPFA